MKKGIKTAGIVALSAVLACGALGALAGCKKKNGGGNGTPIGDKDTLTVSIFCNAQDATTNQKICDQWAAEYNQKNGTAIKVRLTNNEDKGNYFEQLNKEWSTGTTADIIYLAPKYVKSYVENGNILELSQYLNTDEYKKDGKLLTSDVWSNGISYYGYVKGGYTTYKMGQPISEVDGKFFAGDQQVGLYGLPKDYSNFSTGYNRKFFSETLKTAYQTTKPNNGTITKSPTGEGSGEFTSKIKYGEGANDNGYDHHSKKDQCIKYATSGHNDVANEDFTEGQVANIINVGIPTTYYPYNFFRFANYNDAVAGKDPVATLSKAFGGYTVTIPGFPNDSLTITESVFNEVYKDLEKGFNDINVPYNKTIGHVTYTYAEYGALLWAVTYYLNTFAWDENNEGYGGVTGVGANNARVHQTVYGGEQYEGVMGATGSVLYLLPWLAANDADLINDVSTLTAKAIDNKTISNVKDWKSVASTDAYTSKKLTLDDTTKDKSVQYGHNSQNFIETYAAFLAIGSDWNVNPSGDTNSTDRANNGWAYFRTGRSICYGAGSWDAATRNDVKQSTLDFGQMPTPIAEKYALYSEVKDANYQRAIYSNDPAKQVAGSAEEGKQRSDLSAGKTVYSANDILKNQVRRQDKWAARMDTVGYAVAAKVADYPEEHAWKEEAAVSLAARLTLNEEAQKTLLYAGAQLPNFISQCKDFVNYKTAGANGAFSDMLTPEGFWDTSAADAQEVWDGYYALALQMDQLAKEESTQTVDQFLAGKKVKGADVKYDTSYGSTTFKEFAKGETTSRLAYAMKVLRMVTYRADDRDINIRMQYGLNSVRDSSMYTYRDTWMGTIDSRTSVNMMAYLVKKPYEGTGADNKAENIIKLEGDVYTSAYIQMNPTDNSRTWDYYTPAVWCLLKAETAQTLLNNSISDEIATLIGK